MPSPCGITETMLNKSLRTSIESTARRSGGVLSVAGGFSLLELMIVVAISMILAAIAIPMFLTASYNIRLKSAASDLSGFLQRARIQAARQNATYPIRYQNNAGAEEVWVDLNGNGVLDPLEPVIAFSPSIKPAAGAPNGAGGTPTPYVLVGDTAGVTYDNATTLGYSSRGLPCAWAPGVCVTPAAGYFVYYLKDQRPASVGWAAVVVTRGGRTKVVTWNGAAWQ
jgi:prepilin-type N-terminal cleavage/methylation domain-containing protein